MTLWQWVASLPVWVQSICALLIALGVANCLYMLPQALALWGNKSRLPKEEPDDES